MPETNFFWDPVSDNILQERDGAGTVTAEYTTEPGRYGALISQNRGGVESQFHFDALGSTLALSDDNQQVTDTYAYTAFGEVTEHTGSATNPFQYVGQKGYYRDELTGESLVRTRQVSAKQGRWLIPDPLKLLVGYLYANQNPLMRLDPSGLYELDLSPESEDNAPWCEVGRDKDEHIPDPKTGGWVIKPADPNGLPFTIFGDTKPIKFDIACACKCVNLEKAQYQITCILWSYLWVRIAPFNFIKPHSLTGVYGHEQRHVRNLLEVIHAQAETHVKLLEDDVYSSYAACKNAAAGLVSTVRGYPERVETAAFSAGFAARNMAFRIASKRSARGRIKDRGGTQSLRAGRKARTCGWQGLFCYWGDAENVGLLKARKAQEGSPN